MKLVLIVLSLCVLVLAVYLASLDREHAARFRALERRVLILERSQMNTNRMLDGAIEQSEQNHERLEAMGR